MDKKKLTEELLESIKKEKAKETHTKSDEDRIFINSAKNGRVDFIGINKQQIRELSGLYIFMNANPSLTDEELREILKGRLIAFRFLRKVDKTLPNFFNTLKQNGVMSTAKLYENTIYLKPVAIKEQ